jgi:hypothetical protein
MRKILTVAACAAIATTGCSGGKKVADPSPAAPLTSATTATSSATPSPSVDPITAQIQAGDTPQCKLVVGLPTEVVVRGYDAKTKAVDVRCITGTSATSDTTGAAMTTCDTLNPASLPVYYWGAQKATSADQQVYAAKKGGVVVVVPGQTAGEFFTTPGGIASVLLAVGNC